MRLNMKLFALATIFSISISSTIGLHAQKVDNPQTETNIYVKSYEEEKKANKGFTTNESVEEEKIVIDTLNDYYEEDLRIADIIKKYNTAFPVNVNEFLSQVLMNF